EHRRDQQRQQRPPPGAADQPLKQVAARVAVVERVVEVEYHQRRIIAGGRVVLARTRAGGAHRANSRCRAAPGSASRMNDSPIRNVSTPASRSRATSAAVAMPL